MSATAAKVPRPFLGQGLRFPLQVINGRLAVSRGEEKIAQSIRFLLATAKGERVMRPELGSGVHDLVFAPGNSQTETLVAHQVRETLVNHEPRIALAFGGPLMTPEMRATLQRVAAGDAAAAAELAPQMRRLAAGMQSDAVLLDFDTRTWSGRFQQSFVRGVADPRTPEFYAAARYGPRTAALRGGGYGAGLGGLLALPVDAAVRGATGRGYGDFWDRAPQTVATGAFGGGLAGVSNQAIVSGTSNALLNQGVGVGLRSAAILTGARAIPGGIGAAGAEILSIAVFEDREHSAREVTLRTGRAGGIGAVSTVAGSIFGAAATGAVAGSVAPGVGNAIGFVAGLITGVVVYVVLDQALPQVDRTP